MPVWIGVSLLQEDPVSSIEIDLFTDASKVGCGGVLNRKWFSLSWPKKLFSYDINICEVVCAFL